MEDISSPLNAVICLLSKINFVAILKAVCGDLSQQIHDFSLFAVLNNGYKKIYTGGSNQNQSNHQSTSKKVISDNFSSLCLAPSPPSSPH